MSLSCAAALACSCFGENSWLQSGDTCSGEWKEGLEMRTSKYLVGMSVSLEIARPGTMSTLHALTCHAGLTLEGRNQTGW